MMSIERLELSILAMLTPCSNRLRYSDLSLTIDCSYSKDYSQPNCYAYNSKLKIASKIYGNREPRTLNLSNVNRTL